MHTTTATTAHVSAPTRAATSHVATQPTRTQLPTASASHNWKLSARGIMHAEWIKLMSLRSIRLTLLITVFSALALSTLIAWGLAPEFEGAPAEGLVSYALTVANFPSAFVALVFGVLGVFAISSEYSSGMMLSTLTAVPHRGAVFAAKALVLTLISGVTALVLVLGGLGIAAIFMPAAGAELFTGQVVSGVLGGAAYLVLIALFAFGVATLLRSTAGGIAVVVGVTFVMPLGFQIAASLGWEWAMTVLDYLPATLGTVLGMGIAPESAAPAMAETSGPGFWLALAAMAAWAIAALVPAAIALRVRDAK